MLTSNTISVNKELIDKTYDNISVLEDKSVISGEIYRLSQHTESSGKTDRTNELKLDKTTRGTMIKSCDISDFDLDPSYN